MPFKWKGPSARQLSAALLQAGRDGRTEAREVAHSEASYIMEIAEDQAPRDEERLEKSFKMQMNRLRADRTIFHITVGGVVDGRNVDEYALLMHESSYNLGPGSIAKQASVGRTVGPKFLERAFDEREQLMMTAVMQALMDGAKRHVG